MQSVYGVFCMLRSVYCVLYGAFLIIHILCFPLVERDISH